MKVITVLKKNKLLVFVALAYVLVFIFMPDKASESLKNSTYYLIEMAQVLPPIFLLTVVIEALVPKEMIMRSFGKKSGIKGSILALLLGSLSAGPIYAAFPISKTLLNKGASVSNITIILSAWAVIKVPMLANEAKFLGPQFMLLRWILTVIGIFIMAYFMGLLVKTKDLPQTTQSTIPITVNPEYCIGCALCAKQQPDYFEMNGNKAIVKEPLPESTDWDALNTIVRKCPSHAIVLSDIEKHELENRP